MAAFNNGVIMVFDKDKEDTMPYNPPKVPTDYNK